MSSPPPVGRLPLAIVSAQRKRVLATERKLQMPRRKVVAANGPLDQIDSHIVYKNIEHVNRPTFVVARLTGRFPVDGGDDRLIFLGENDVQKFSQGGLKFFDGILSQCSADGRLGGSPLNQFGD